MLGQFNNLNFTKSLFVPELKKRLSELLKLRSIFQLLSKIMNDWWILFEFLSLALLVHPLSDLGKHKFFFGLLIRHLYNLVSVKHSFNEKLLMFMILVFHRYSILFRCRNHLLRNNFPYFLLFLFLNVVIRYFAILFSSWLFKLLHNYGIRLIEKLYIFKSLCMLLLFHLKFLYGLELFSVR